MEQGIIKTKQVIATITKPEEEETLENLDKALELLVSRVKNLANKNKFSKKVTTQVELDFN